MSTDYCRHQLCVLSHVRLTAQTLTDLETYQELMSSLCIFMNLKHKAGRSRRLSYQQHISAPPGVSLGVCAPNELYSPSSEHWVCPGISCQLDLSGTPPKGGVLIRCLNHLSYLRSMGRSSGSPLSSLRSSELLTLSLTLTPATMWRKLISATCIRNLILLVTQSS